MDTLKPSAVPVLVYVLLCLSYNVEFNPDNYSEVSWTDNKVEDKTSISKIPDWLLNPRCFTNRTYHVCANPNQNPTDAEQEMTRAASFLQFPGNRSTPARRNDFIRAGFRYCCQSDKLYCHICKAVYDDWQSTGNLSEAHKSCCKFRRQTVQCEDAGGRHPTDQMHVSEVSQSSQPAQNQQPDSTPSSVTELPTETGGEENVQETSGPIVRHVAQTVSPENDVSPQLLVSTSAFSDVTIAFQGERDTRMTPTEEEETTIGTGENLGACGGSDDIPELHHGNMTIGGRVFSAPSQDIDLHDNLSLFENRPEVLSIRHMGYEVDVIRRAYQQLREESGTTYHGADVILQRIEEENEISLDEVVQENRRLKKERACCVCLEYYSEVVLCPCGHANLCGDCSSKVDKCPTCRTPIEKKLPFCFG